MLAGAGLGATVEGITSNEGTNHSQHGEKNLEKTYLSRSWGKYSEKICNDSSVIDLPSPVYFHSNIINNKYYQGI